jgi:hypothetical protein
MTTQLVAAPTRGRTEAEARAVANALNLLARLASENQP